MEQRKQKNTKRYALLGVAAFAAVYILLVDAIGGVSATDQLLFLAAQVAFVLIPGLAITLIVNPPGDIVKLLIVSYMIGFGVVVGEYFLFSALGLHAHMTVCMSAVSAVGIYGIYRKRDTLKRTKTDMRAAGAYGIFLAAVLVAVLAIGLTTYRTPDLSPTGSAYLYQDVAWNTGNTVSLAWGLPVQDIHVDGFSFGYHYFVNAFLAPLYNMLGISAYTLYVKLLAIVQVFIFTGGLYLLFSLLFKNKWLRVCAAGATALCSALILQHMFWYAYATPLSMGLACAAAYFFIRFSRKMDTASVKDRDFLMFLMLLMVATGVKTLLAVGVIAGAGILILAQIFYRKKNTANLLLAGVVLLAAVAGLYVGMVYGTHTFNSLQRAFAAPMWMGAAPEYYLKALEIFPGMPELLVKIMCYPVYLAENYLVLVVAVILILVALGKKKAGYRRIRLFLLAGIVTGLVAASVLYQPGMSNLFFLEGTLPLCAFALFLSVKEHMDNKRLDASEKRMFYVIMGAVFAFQAVFNIGVLQNDYTNGLPAVGRTGAVSQYDSITAGQYEGMLWLKNETAKDAVFATDRQHYTPSGTLADARYYYYTAFSERQCYAEGYNYISTHNADFERVIDDRYYAMLGVYANDPASIERLIADGVDYLVATRFLHPDFTLDNRYGTLAYENADIAIYALGSPGAADS